jgi:arginine deiminase
MVERLAQSLFRHKAVDRVIVHVDERPRNAPDTIFTMVDRDAVTV